MTRKVGAVILLALLIAAASTAVSAAETQTQVVWEKIVSAEALVGKEEAENHGLRISSLAVDLANPDRIAVGLSCYQSLTKDRARPVLALLGLYQSFDRGQTWQFAGAPPTTLTPFPIFLWFEEGLLYTYFAFESVYRWDASSDWTFQTSSLEFLSSSKSDDFPGAFKFDRWPTSGLWPGGGYAVKDPQFTDITYIPKSTAANPNNTLPSPDDGLYLSWDNGSRIARVAQPVNPAYVMVAGVLRADNATVLYVKTVAVEAGKGFGDVWRLTIPDSILENPERLFPTVLTLRIGSSDMIVEKGEVATVPLDAVPEISNDRTFLPIRPVVEALGGKISWFNEDQRVEIQQGNRKITLWINRATALVDGVEVPIDPNNLVRPYVAPPGRTMLPLRFVSEALGAEVEWDGATRTITITYPKP